MGAGIFGLSSAWAMVQRGARVQVIDPQGVAAGASGGIVGALAPHTPERWNAKKAFQFDSLVMAEDFWRRVDAASGRDSGYGRLGRLQPVKDAKALDLARARAETARDLWQDKFTWEVLQAQGDWMPSSETGLVVRDSLSARLHPRQACESLAEALRRAGVSILRDGAAKGQVLWATGVAGLTALSDHFDRPLGNGVKGQAALIGFDGRGLPQIFAEALHIIPHADGTTAIGSTSERDFEAPDTTDDRLTDVITRARAALPAIADAPVLARWAGLRPRAKSRAPMLGAWPDRPGHYIANGGFKIGFGMAAKAGEVMADLVLDGHNTIPEDFHPSASF